MMVFGSEVSIAILAKNLLLEILAIGGLIANLIFITATIKYKHYQNRVGFLMMLSLALADIGNLLLICGHIALGLELGDTVETAIAYYNIILWYSSLIHYVVIAVHRLYSVVNPTNVDNIFSFRATVYMLVMGWLLSFLMACLPLTGVCCKKVVSFDLFHDVHTEAESNSSNATPHEDYTHESEASLNVWAIVAQVANALTLITLIYCYTRVYRRIQSIQVHNSGIMVLSRGGNHVAGPLINEQVTRRISYQFITVSVIFCCILITELLIQTGISRNSTTDEVLKYLFTINSSCHPIIYALFTIQLGHDMQNILFCGKLRTQNATRGTRTGGQPIIAPSMPQ